MQQNNQFWALSMVKLQLDELPGWEQICHIITWPKPNRKFLYYRDAILKNEGDEEFGRLSSVWLLMGKNSRQPEYVKKDRYIFNENRDRHAITELPTKLKGANSHRHISERKVYYNDIDLNNHLTATKYIDWMLDTNSVDFYSKNKIIEIQVNFLKEIPFGTKVKVRRETLGDTIHYDIVSFDATTTYFRGQSIHREK